MARRICLRVYENAMKRNHWLDKVISSFAGLKIWQRRKRWSRITPSLNISNVLMRRNDKHCGLLTFKFSALITLEGLMLLIEAWCDHCNFRFLLEHISAVYKDPKWWSLEKVYVWSWPRLYDLHETTSLLRNTLAVSSWQSNLFYRFSEVISLQSN